MTKITEVKLSLSIFREGKTYIAFSPALDISTAGKSATEAKKNFDELVQIFFEETEKHGTTEDALLSLGWEKLKSKKWQPPVEVEHTTTRVAVPA
ncbi:hypothetical protein HYW35_00015 [Candidatus Saccharibacteria bacterium]|nr:hypothetical protein [Candidatus Saccharibacteria bacterium]